MIKNYYDLYPIYNGIHVIRCIKLGSYWFLARDVCSLVGIKTPNKIINQIPSKYKKLITKPLAKGEQYDVLIDVKCFLLLIKQYNSDNVDSIKKWIEDDVVPVFTKKQFTPQQTKVTRDYNFDVTLELYKQYYNKQADIDNAREDLKQHATFRNDKTFYNIGILDEYFTKKEKNKGKE